MKGTTKKTLLMLALTLALGAGANQVKAAEGHHYVLKEGSVVFTEADDGKSASWTAKLVCDLKGHENEELVKRGNTDKKTSVAGTCNEDAIAKEAIVQYDHHIWKDTVEVDGQKLDIESEKIADTGAKKHEHDFEEISRKVNTMATCEEGGTADVQVKCKNCGKVETRKNVETVAIGHSWSYTYQELNNVTLEGENTAYPKPTLVNTSKNGTYVIVATCANGDHHTKVEKLPARAEDEDVVDAKVSGGKVYITVEVSVAKFEKGPVIVTNEKWNTELVDGKLYLINCNKPGKYDLEYYVPGKAEPVKVVHKDLEAQHYPGRPEAEKLSKNLEDRGYNSDNSLNIVNKSCAEDGTYQEVVYCTRCKDAKGNRTELSRKTVTVPKSKIHTADKVKKYENFEGDCVKGGKADEVTVCGVCGVEMSRKRVDYTPGKHDPADPVVENEKKATAHKDGYYESVVYCKRCGKELDRTRVVVAATDPDHYNWKYTLQWQGYGSNSVSEAKNATYDMGETGTPSVWLLAAPTDDDLTAAEKKERTTKLYIGSDIAGTVTEDLSKRVEGSTCTLGSRTFTVAFNSIVDTTEYHEERAKVSNDPKDPTDVVKSDDFANTVSVYTVKTSDYKGHEFVDGVCKHCGAKQEVKEEEPEETEETKPELKSIKGAKIENLKKIAYRGEYSPIPYKVTLDGKTLKENVDFVFTNTQKNEFKAVGSHKVTIAGIGEYKGTAKGKLYIDQANQKIKVSLSKKTFKASALKKKAASFQITVKNAKGKVTYTSKNKKVTVSKKGKVTLKKGLKAGKYKITVKAAATKNYKAASKTVTFTVK